jgi:poly-beta-1,6-N-acetyl-D-glucosamine synthase
MTAPDGGALGTGWLGGGGTIAVTCAHNEERYLPTLAASMAAQSVAPRLWVVVDDGSTDGTGALLDRLAGELSFLRVVRRPPGTGPSFASKVRAFEAGWEVARAEWPEVVACVDADVVLPADYVQAVEAAFRSNPRLGVTGARYAELVRGRRCVDDGPPAEIPGCAQAFRAEALAAIGGYQRLPFGGEDTLAGVDARALGWETEVVAGLVVEHLRNRDGLPLAARLAAARRSGRCDHDVGSPWWYALAKALRRLGEPPLLLGGLARLGGYAHAAATRAPRHASARSVAALRAEQRDEAAAAARRASARLAQAVGVRRPPEGRTDAPGGRGREGRVA